MEGQIPTPMSEMSQQSMRPRPLNFSRPRPTGYESGNKVTRDRSDTGGSNHVQSFSAFQDPNGLTPTTPSELPGDFPPPSTASSDLPSELPGDLPSDQLPNEPRFSGESARTHNTATTTSTHSTGKASSAASEFAWDPESGELRSRRRPQEFDAQRARQSRSTTGTSQQTSSSATTAVNSDTAFLAELPGSQPSRDSRDEDDSAPPPIPSKWGHKIVKRTSFDQMSERISISGHTEDSNSSAGGWEDTGSHHTVSVDGDGSGNGNGEGPDSRQIQKMKKKGINPALYAEMKAARKGKGKWAGPLAGNSFLG